MSGTFAPSGAPDQIIASGDVRVGKHDSLIVLNKCVAAATTRLQLPSVADREGLPLWVFDWTGLAGDMTFITEDDELVMGVASPFRVGSGGAGMGGSLLLIPSVELHGWLVR